MGKEATFKVVDNTSRFECDYHTIKGMDGWFVHVIDRSKGYDVYKLIGTFDTNKYFNSRNSDINANDDRVQMFKHLLVAMEHPLFIKVFKISPKWNAYSSKLGGVMEETAKIF